MSIGNAVLNLLGLAPQFAQAEAIISGTETAVEALKIIAGVFNSDAGIEGKHKLAALLAGSVQKEDGTIHLDVAHTVPDQPRGHWEWEWDAMDGYVNPHFVENSK